MQSKTKKTDYGITSDEIVERDGYKYRVMLGHTPWLKEGDDLAEVAKKVFGDNLKRGGTVTVAEKVSIVTSGRLVPASSIKPGWFARYTSKFVRPKGNDLAQSIPERMQFVIDSIGFPRTFLACVASALTKPFGIAGAFFVVAGYRARDLDGMQDEYKDWLLPPLSPKQARDLIAEVSKKAQRPFCHY